MKKVLCFILAFVFAFCSFSVFGFAGTSNSDSVEIPSYPERNRYFAVWQYHYKGNDGYKKVIDYDDYRNVVLFYVTQWTPEMKFEFIDVNSERYEIAKAVFKANRTEETGQVKNVTFAPGNKFSKFKYGAMAFQTKIQNVSKYFIFYNNGSYKVLTSSERDEIIGNSYRDTQSVDNPTQMIVYWSSDNKVLTPPADEFYLRQLAANDNNDYINNYQYTDQENWPKEYGGGGQIIPDNPQPPETPETPETPDVPDEPDTPEENSFMNTLANIWSSVVSFFQMIINFFISVFNAIGNMFG